MDHASSRFESAAARVAAHPRAAAFACGLVAATGFEPWHLWPLALAALAVFALLVARSAGWRQAAWLGWWFGLAHFTLGLNWIATAFTYQANMPAFLGWLAVPLLSVYLAVWPAAAAGLARLAAGERSGWPFVAALGGAWTFGEFARGNVFTGFAWNPLASIGLGGFEAQGLGTLAPFLGTYALSGLVVAVAGAFGLLLARKRLVPAGFLAAALTSIMLWPAGEGAQGTRPYTVVQPNLEQDVLYMPDRFEANFVELARQSLPLDEPREGRIVMWPESGLVDYLREGYPQRYYTRFNYGGSAEAARARIARIIGPDSILLTGSQELELEDGQTVGAYNAVTALDGAGDIRDVYYKAHLVPYGEYLALRWLLEPLGATRLVPGAYDFLPGPGPRTLALDEFGRVGIQVCYEIVFPGEVADRGDRPEFIFNDSTDGWFGAWGAPQHFAQARLRAVEEGLPVLRSTTNGISGVIDARGVVRDFLPSRVAGRMDGFVPPAAPPTPFALFGNWLSLGWALLFLVGAVVVRRRGRG